jgi:RNA polymerase sigma-70 factor (ECF subfamily)
MADQLSHQSHESEARESAVARLDDLVALLSQRQDAFRGFLHRRVEDAALAEDLLQQSLVRAVERHRSVRDETSAVAWFYQILRNTLVDYYRSRGAEARRDDAYLRELIATGQDKEPPPGEITATICACLNRLLPSLRPNYADLLRRIDLEGESPQQVAAALNISPNNLTVRLHRARQALRASLEETCGICTTHGCLDCTCE